MVKALDQIDYRYPRANIINRIKDMYNILGEIKIIVTIITLIKRVQNMEQAYNKSTNYRYLSTREY